MGGKVYLIGAGPGDPELITVKALKAIQRADVILYDRLVNQDLLKEARADTNLIYCGKLPKVHHMKQETINHLLVKYGKKDRNVVRLKGGDPFVFGRGAEEAIALAKNGVEYEVIPGITSGIAVPAYADIPITHRELGRSFAVVTGHCKNGKPAEIQWEYLAKSVDTLAIYMGMSNLSYITEKLLDSGKSAQTPIAIIQEGTTANQKVVKGTLQSIVNIVEQHNMRNPAMIVVGDVVKVSNTLQYLKERYQEQSREIPALEAY
ncbi:uroporphyrinogen-III methyltransferase [Gracilibacillus boraciitolerans JCM 21714]|uniref:Uroporphyrinogen-III C-methyltransferase n=1 Tax=Gracilibacillus boraciitolerans JCM 21714 TaxID=1298598 RepID=W4VQN1_9BACI|nr:uroporphyrinogen-III C-methyltransferase [Gracilibacillus boraciitolerans]GAE95109.1 uroporphyrinogen-III methyltransferase [Gracilibacillus boraciitolerans JCM 21714]